MASESPCAHWVHSLHLIQRETVRVFLGVVHGSQNRKWCELQVFINNISVPISDAIASR